MIFNCTKLFLGAMVFVVFNINNYACSQSRFMAKKVPETLINQFNVEVKGISNNAYALENSLPKGYSVTGSVDYTRELQLAINTHKVILFPNFPIKIKNGLILKSNSVLYFQPESAIIFDGQATKKLDDIIKVYDVSNVKIYNPKIIGNKFSKVPQKGEWCAGISILNSDAISIFNPVISKTWGDGIFIGSENSRLSSNILISGGWIDQARRNGISITSAKDVSISNVLISNTMGTAPQCAIDIEPSTFTDVLMNINLNHITTYNNVNASFAINLGSFCSSKESYQNDVNITVNNLTDYSSTNFLGFVFNPKNLKYTAKANIDIKNSKSVGSKRSVWKDGHRSNSIVKFDRVGKQLNKAAKLEPINY